MIPYSFKSKGSFEKIYNIPLSKIIKKIFKKISRISLIDYFKCELFIRNQVRNRNLFSNIEIETINRCNGLCPFCPVNANEKQRPYAKMKESLFYKIIDELKEVDYRGSIALYSNNEPFLDNRIIEFYKYTRNCLPRAYVYIYTNGTLLSFSKFLSIIPYLDKMIIDNYDDNYIKHPNVAKIFNHCSKHPILQEKVEIRMLPLNQVMTSRGGLAPNKGKQKAPKRKCTLPFRQMIVRPDGKVSLCSNDALGVYTMGDVKKQSLKEIWDNEYFREIRGEMLTNGRQNLKLCQDCDNVIVSKILDEHSR